MNRNNGRERLMEREGWMGASDKGRMCAHVLSTNNDRRREEERG